MKEIKLTQGKTSVVDDDDFELVVKYTWSAHWERHSFYARTTIKINGENITIPMHRLIMNPPKGYIVDHKDHDGLNNQKSNLRICTVSQNQINTYKRFGCTSKYKGVHFAKKDNKWRAQIYQNNIFYYLGLYDTETEAAIVYNNAAKIRFGEYANLNNTP